MYHLARMSRSCGAEFAVHLEMIAMNDLTRREFLASTGKTGVGLIGAAAVAGAGNECEIPGGGCSAVHVRRIDSIHPKILAHPALT